MLIMDIDLMDMEEDYIDIKEMQVHHQVVIQAMVGDMQAIMAQPWDLLIMAELAPRIMEDMGPQGDTEEDTDAINECQIPMLMQDMMHTVMDIQVLAQVMGTGKHFLNQVIFLSNE